MSHPITEEARKRCDCLACGGIIETHTCTAGAWVGVLATQDAREGDLLSLFEAQAAAEHHKRGEEHFAPYKRRWERLRTFTTQYLGGLGHGESRKLARRAVEDQLEEMDRIEGEA